MRHHEVRKAITGRVNGMCDKCCIDYASQQEIQVSSLKHPDPYTKNAEDR